MSTSGSTVSIPTAGRYELDPQKCSISFTTRHVFGLAPVTGTFRVDSGNVTIAQPLTDSSLEAQTSVASFDTGNPERDEHVRSEAFLDGAHHPYISFRSTALERSGDSWALHGVLTARGKAAPTVLDIVELQQEDGVLTVRATAKVDRFAHGISRMPRMAGRHLTLRLIATATGV